MGIGTDDLIEYDLLFGTASHNDDDGNNMHNSGASHYNPNKHINHKQTSSMDDDVLEMKRRLERRVSRDLQRRKDMGIGHSRNDSQLMFDDFRINHNKTRMSEDDDDDDESEDDDDMKGNSNDEDYLQNKERDSESVGDSDNENGKKKGKQGKRRKSKFRNNKKKKKNKKEEKSGYDTVLKKLGTEKEKVVFEGYLDRKTNQSVFGRKLWERRYFKLKTHALSIFVDENGIYPECMFFVYFSLFTFVILFSRLCHDIQQPLATVSRVHFGILIFIFVYLCLYNKIKTTLFFSHMENIIN